MAPNDPSNWTPEQHYVSGFMRSKLAHPLGHDDPDTAVVGMWPVAAPVISEEDGGWVATWRTVDGGHLTVMLSDDPYERFEYLHAV